MAEPWVALSEDEYPCPVLPPARAAGSVRNNYFSQEFQEAHDVRSPWSADQADKAEATGLPQSPVPATLSALLLLTLPVALPLIVYMGVNNPFISARSGLLVEDLLDLDDDVSPIVTNSAQKGRYLRTVDGGFEEELGRLAAASPPEVPLWAQQHSNSRPPPLRKVVHRPPEVAWPAGGKGSGGVVSATLGPQPPPEDEDAPMKRMLPFKKMRREDRPTTKYVLPADGAATFNDLPELLEFTRRMTREKRRGSKSSVIPIMREP
ncbi:uncharacterized protein LOC144123476 [Amblyomma americanum]